MEIVNGTNLRDLAAAVAMGYKTSNSTLLDLIAIARNVNPDGLPERMPQQAAGVRVAAWRWYGGQKWHYADGEPTQEQRDWAVRHGHHVESLAIEPPNVEVCGERSEFAGLPGSAAVTTKRRSASADF